jgi:hypothetical protein
MDLGGGTLPGSRLVGVTMPLVEEGFLSVTQNMSVMSTDLWGPLHLGTGV